MCVWLSGCAGGFQPVQLMETGGSGINKYKLLLLLLLYNMVKYHLQVRQLNILIKAQFPESSLQFSGLTCYWDVVGIERLRG